LAGTFETLFERYSLETLISGNAGSLVKSVLKQGLAEGSEELWTSIANAAADSIIMAEKSDYSAKINAYMEQGFSEEEARKQAFMDTAIQIGWDFVGGAISGGIFGGGHGIAGNISQNRQAKEIRVYDFLDSLKISASSIRDILILINTIFS